MLKILLLPLAVLALAASGCADDGDETATTTPLLDGATTADPDSGTDAQLRIVLDGGEFDGLSYTITCTGGAATVEPEVEGVDPVTACQRLQHPDVVQRLVEGPPADRICTEVYGGPQVATITGAIDGDAVDTKVGRTNGCEIDTWDRLLTGVLPPTQGARAGE